jgi:hypothetical protein
LYLCDVRCLGFCSQKFGLSNVRTQEKKYTIEFALQSIVEILFRLYHDKSSKPDIFRCIVFDGRCVIAVLRARSMNTRRLGGDNRKDLLEISAVRLPGRVYLALPKWKNVLSRTRNATRQISLTTTLPLSCEETYRDVATRNLIWHSCDVYFLG